MRLTIKLIKFLEDLTLLILRFFPAEASKNITLKLLKLIYNLNLISLFASSNIEKPKINVKNLSLANRIGIAGGLDKNAEYFHIFSSLGFGFVEVGTVTLEPQTGNPKPRIFRYTKDKTIVNNKTGFLFKANDTNDLSNKLSHIFELDETTLKSMGNEGRKSTINKFNVEKMCFSTYSEYKKLINA